MKQTRNNRNLRKRNMRKNTTIRRKNKMNGGGMWSWKDVMGRSYSKNSSSLIGKFILVYISNEERQTYQIYKVLGVSSEKGSKDRVQYTRHNCIKYDLKFNRDNQRDVVKYTGHRYDFECSKTKCGNDSSVMAVEPVLLFHQTKTSPGYMGRKKEDGFEFAVLEKWDGTTSDDNPKLTITKEEHDKLGSSDKIESTTFQKWANDVMRNEGPPVVLNDDNMYNAYNEINALDPEKMTNEQKEEQEIIKRIRGNNTRNTRGNNTMKRGNRKGLKPRATNTAALIAERGDKLKKISRQLEAMGNIADKFANNSRKVEKQRKGWFS